jgi:hypothetical protein
MYNNLSVRREPAPGNERVQIDEEDVGDCIACFDEGYECDVEIATEQRR